MGQSTFHTIIIMVLFILLASIMNVDDKKYKLIISCLTVVVALFVIIREMDKSH